MNYRAVVNVIGRIILLEAILMCFPIIVDLIYQESTWLSFLIPLACLAVMGTLMVCFVKPKETLLYAKEGFVITALAWVIMSLMGAIPFVISGVLPNYIEAFFEATAGFTTTGASVIEHTELIPHSLLFWRSFMHWVGGMGILVFVLALIPKQEGGSMHILRAESTGPNVGKIVSKMNLTARILYVTYAVLTVVFFIFLIAGRMPLFDAICNALSTAGTGGVILWDNSFAHYNSVYLEMVTAVFMFIFGINFNVFYLILIGKFSDVLKMEELRTYFIIVILATVLIALDIMTLYKNFGEALRYAFFQVTSIVSTTGYVSADFNAWPTFAKIILMMLMVTGACAGSTSGGLKISRIIILSKSSFTDMRKMLHPRQVIKTKLDGDILSESTIRNTKTYLVAYVGVIVMSLLLISFEGYGNVETNLTAVLACFNNIGVGFELVGPFANYAGYSDFSKLILSVIMLAGRLEIFPILLLFTPSTWRKV
ncbi:MAG: TrkH family potassium uptake protein [Clostridia bacterium]|nr:TrkH family potassium uptake protein [Clostridia bacterium]